MKKNNLFQFATSELSQDAIICWCLNWIHYPESKLYSLAVELFKLLGQENVDSSQKITIKKQVKKIDILVLFHDTNKILIIEDKTFSSEHSDQIKRYKQTIQQELSTDFKVDDNTIIQTVYFKTGYFFDDDKLIGFNKKADIIVDAQMFFDVIANNKYKGLSEILDDYAFYLKTKLEDNKRYENIRGEYIDGGRYIAWNRITQYTLMRTFFPEERWEKNTGVFKVYSRSNTGGRPWTETMIVPTQFFTGSEDKYDVFWRIDSDSNGTYLSLRFYEWFNKKENEKLKRHEKTYYLLLNLAKEVIESEKLCFNWNDVEDGFRGRYKESSLLRIGLDQYLVSWEGTSAVFVDSVRHLTDCFIEKFNAVEI